jgi:hypothetical protein
VTADDADNQLRRAMDEIRAQRRAGRLTPVEVRALMAAAVRRYKYEKAADMLRSAFPEWKIDRGADEIWRASLTTGTTDETAALAVRTGCVACRTGRGVALRAVFRIARRAKPIAFSRYEL